MLQYNARVYSKLTGHMPHGWSFSDETYNTSSSSNSDSNSVCRMQATNQSN